MGDTVRRNKTLVTLRGERVKCSRVGKFPRVSLAHLCEVVLRQHTAAVGLNLHIHGKETKHC